jgi:hypothetical protein
LKKLISLFVAGLILTAPVMAADKEADAKKASAAKKPKKPMNPDDEGMFPPQPSPPTVAGEADPKKTPAPANKIDPTKPVSPLVLPKAPLVKGEPPGGYPKLDVPNQPKGNIDPSSVKATTVYSYRDEKGTDLFADNLDAVPKQYRDKAKKVQRK